jgi:hypothetical protein
MDKPFVYMKASRGDWWNAYRPASMQVMVDLFCKWALTARTSAEHAHVANEASFLLSCGYGKYADRLAPLTRY